MHPFLAAFAPSFGVQASDTTTATAVTTTTSATAYNNITPVELIASTAQDASWLTIRLPSTVNSAATRSSSVFEIMAGAASSEYSIIGPVSFGYYSANSTWSFPILIPGGTRLSIRVRSARTSLALNWNYVLGYGVNRDAVGLPQRWVAYGMNDDTSANAQGTIVVPGNATWGSWTSLTTSTTYAHDLWMPMVDGGTQTVMTALSTRTRWAIASTADAATMATNATVHHGPWTITTTSEVMNDGFSSSQARQAGGFGGTNGIIYAPRAAGAAVSASARCSAAPNTDALGCSILAAI